MLRLAVTAAMLSCNIGQLRRHLLFANGSEEANDGLRGKAKLGRQIGCPRFRFGERFGADPNLL
jgi:hypothetical protein